MATKRRHCAQSFAPEWQAEPLATLIGLKLDPTPADGPGVLRDAGASQTLPEPGGSRGERLQKHPGVAGVSQDAGAIWWGGVVFEANQKTKRPQPSTKGTAAAL